MEKRRIDWWNDPCWYTERRHKIWPNMPITPQEISQWRQKMQDYHNDEEEQARVEQEIFEAKIKYQRDMDRLRARKTLRKNRD